MSSERGKRKKNSPDSVPLLIVIPMGEDSSETVSILLLSLQRLCRNLSDLLMDLDADVDLFESLIDQLFAPMKPLSSSSSLVTVDEEEDFYERMFDEQLEPKAIRVTDLWLSKKLFMQSFHVPRVSC